MVNRTSSVELLRWTNRLRLSTKVTVVVVVALAAGLLVLFLLLLVACCLRRSRVMRRSRRARRSTDVVCPSSRVIASSSSEDGTLPVRGRKPLQPNDVVDDCSTPRKCSRGTCGDGAGGSSITQCGTQLQLPSTLTTFGGKTERLSTYVTFQVWSVFSVLLAGLYNRMLCFQH